MTTVAPTHQPQSAPRRIFFSVGEPSGDVHGANLIRELRRQTPELTFTGFGGEKMKAAGCELRFDLTSLAVMWFAQAIWNIGKFWNLYRDANRTFASGEVDLVILIDFPGFNWWVARAAKRHGIPVYYYGAPQMWAWASWRIHKMKRLVNVALCKLPFEARWYQQRGMRACYVGHPFYDEVANHVVDQTFVAERQSADAPWLLLLPGSRQLELERNLATLLDTATDLHQRFPRLRFAISCVSQTHAQWCLEHMTDSQREMIQVTWGKTADWMRVAKACVACSGSVSLELMDNQIPTVIVYRINRIGYLGIWFLMQVRYITLVNLLWTSSIEKQTWNLPDPESPDAEDVPYPEYVSLSNPASRVATRIAAWLNDESLLKAKREQLAALKRDYGQLGASAQAATLILEEFQRDRESNNESSTTHQDTPSRAA